MTTMHSAPAARPKWLVHPPVRPTIGGAKGQGSDLTEDRNSRAQRGTQAPLARAVTTDERPAQSAVEAPNPVLGSPPLRSASSTSISSTSSSSSSSSSPPSSPAPPSPPWSHCHISPTSTDVKRRPSQTPPFAATLSERLRQGCQQPAGETANSRDGSSINASSSSCCCYTEDGSHGGCITFNVEAPADSPYSGACFQLALDQGNGSLVWLTPIYHPALIKDCRVCECVTGISGHNAASLAHSDTGQPLTMAGEPARRVAALLSHPELYHPCSKCEAMNERAYTEVQSDTAFFHRKARAHTPSAAPPPDDELRQPLCPTVKSFDFSMLLRTGIYSDIRILCGRTVFRCHRTILAAGSAVLAANFAQQADHGTVTLDVHPRTAARLLHFVYSQRLPQATAMDARECIDLLRLATRLRVPRLMKFCTAALRVACHSLDGKLVVQELRRCGCADAVLGHNDFKASHSPLMETLDGAMPPHDSRLTDRQSENTVQKTSASQAPGPAQVSPARRADSSPRQCSPSNRALLSQQQQQQQQQRLRGALRQAGGGSFPRQRRLRQRRNSPYVIPCHQ